MGSEVKMSDLFKFALIFCAFVYVISNNINDLTYGGDEIPDGRSARPGEFPFVVSLRDRRNRRHFCTGSIINRNTILTAAYCLTVTKSFLIVVGTTNVDGRGKIYNVAAIVRHTMYEEDIEADVALIRTSRMMQLNKFVFPIRIYKNRLPAENFDLLTIGWNVTADLRVVDIVSVKLKACRQAWNETEIEDFNLCLNGTNLCEFDAGSPVVKRNRIVGLLSLPTYRCNNYDGNDTLPIIVTNLMHYSDWVMVQVENLRI